ncbi:cysteine desulfurase family protein [Gluconobacter oxydans]|uniref:Cysteine desulfurase n=1 Tax=Gluconobacter oxydans TaxID=442 RepID=A0AB35ARP8_GLUOY|nr:cysteine desulfurase family protein [Gluconobacter oxydans]KXV31928.1 cysteine desulfurase [Gluconobacter oxydans]MBF0857037.1 cysteine desulfurase [Gluconobacter oxydans]MCP1249441.1 cysteine desulfurase [Gluconobacter oxydans]TCW23547.1 cysteine desulfurase [Gluconobacter oxydans]GEC61800.1 cysteine desulfurase IscS [Gluconobacter oxydans]
MIYLDYLSTTPCDPEVVRAMLPWFGEDFGNPHSPHGPGRKAADAVERARESVARLLGVEAREIVFTSGATEANNLAIKGATRHLARLGDPRRRIVTVATEHKCVLGSVRDLEREGFEAVVLGVDGEGRVDPQALREALKVPTLLVSVMAANNETGVLQDIPQLAAIVKERGALMHVDLAQMAGKMPVSLRDVDLASVSAHKMYGPKGIGALYVRRKPRVRLEPLFSGGGQERGLRSGTLPTPLIVGFGEAADLAASAMGDEAARQVFLRDDLWAQLREGLPGIVLNGAGAPRLAGALNVCLPDGVRALDVLEACPDVAASTGSACTAAEIAPSYVLTAMGLSAEKASRCLRLSVGRSTSKADIDRAASLLIAAARACQPN